MQKYHFSGNDSTFPAKIFFSSPGKDVFTLFFANICHFVEAGSRG